MHHRYEIVGGNQHGVPNRRRQLWWMVATVGIVTFLCWLEGWPASFLTAEEANKSLLREEATPKSHSGGVASNDPKDEGSSSSPPIEEAATHNDKATTTKPNQHDGPDVAWIVSFGGSGTSYTILNTEAMSGQSTASNYARDYKTLIPVQDTSFGPYIRSPEKPLPQHYILTKTHCGGYCMDCPPSSYVFKTALEFQIACRTTQIEEETLVEQVYEADIPKRAVHLVRSPFDNIVGRFHLSVRRWKKRKGVNATEMDLQYPNTAEGLLNWCRYLDEAYQEQESHYAVLKQYQNVPCHAEWFRYIQWHNLADTVLHDLDIPVHYLWYHNYTSGFDETVSSLFDFLDLEPTGEPYEWHAGHSYKSFYPQDLRKAAIGMMKDLASATTWRLIEDYIADYSTTEVWQDTPLEVVEFDEGEFNHDEDSMYIHEEEHGDSSFDTTAVSNNVDDAVDPKVVWLLSFPNSVGRWLCMEYALTHLVTGNFLHYFECRGHGRRHHRYQLRS